MSGIRHQKRGENHTFTVSDVGRTMRITVTEHGYRLKASAEIKFDALTDRQAIAVRTTLHNIVDEALTTAAMQRHVNVPLFGLESADEAQQTQGVNER